MLREEIINEWDRLKKIIKDGFDQSYQWGQLLRHLGIICLVPNLTLKWTVAEIKENWVSKSEFQQAIYLEKENFQTTIRDLKREFDQEKDDNNRRQISRLSAVTQELRELANQITFLQDEGNRPVIKQIILNESSLSKAQREAREWERRFYNLRSVINSLDFALPIDLGDDSGPTIEEVE